HDMLGEPESDAEPQLPAPSASWPHAEAGEEPRDLPRSGRLWADELPRWLATLNSGRTAQEYDKAVGYFFQTPGVPQNVADLSFDLLLAYRGARAPRAIPHADGGALAGRRAWRAHPHLAASLNRGHPILEAEQGERSGSAHQAESTAADPNETQTSPLAPA